VRGTFLGVRGDGLVASVATAITCVPRARTSCMLNDLLEHREIRRDAATSVCSSSISIDPCFISPAA
jgi:hypothetical protein